MVSSSTPDPVRGNNSATTTTTVSTSADLAVTKMGASAVIAGNNITYTITVTNIGPSSAKGVSLMDSLPGGESVVSRSQPGGGPQFTLSNIGNAITDTISTLANGASRSEERRVGKECRSRWSPNH